MSRFVWCEDTGSGFEFWKKLFEAIYSDIQVESKGNNSELRKAVTKIDDDVNTYYILVDNAIDNPDVLREVNQIKKVEASKENVIVVDVFSFEFCLLSFENLIDWIFAKEDELKEKRKELLELRELFIRVMSDMADIDEQENFFLKLDELNYNAEQLSSKLLFEITRNTGFETSKSKLGQCFVVDCCEWSGRQDDDICGLDDSRISASEKIKLIMEKSVLSRAFTEVGL